jgi:hypothetical protein
MLEGIKPGLETSIRDYPGRIGYWVQGFPPSGPMDSWSLRLANLLVGNPARSRMSIRRPDAQDPARQRRCRVRRRNEADARRRSHADMGERDGQGRAGSARARPFTRPASAAGKTGSCRRRAIAPASVSTRGNGPSPPRLPTRRPSTAPAVQHHRSRRTRRRHQPRGTDADHPCE